MKKIVFDLDETLCEKKKKNESYFDVKPIDEMCNAVRELKRRGYYIIISTARNMLTQNNNVGRVVMNVGQDTLNWLDKNNIPYDEIHFGKPYSDTWITLQRKHAESDFQCRCCCCNRRRRNG